MSIYAKDHGRYPEPNKWCIIKQRKGKNSGEVDYGGTLMNIMNDPGRMDATVDIISLLKTNTSIKRIIVMARFRNTLEVLLERLGHDDAGLFYSVTSKTGKKMVRDTLENKKVILAINALGEQSLNIKDCN